jgi:hypothetical protein
MARRDIEKTHPDLFWYGIHGIELLFALMEPIAKVYQDFFQRYGHIGWNLEGRTYGSYRGTRLREQGFWGDSLWRKGKQNLWRIQRLQSFTERIINFLKPECSCQPRRKQWQSLHLWKQQM